MKFNSQICTSRSQSERVLALGLKKETADCSLNTITLHGTPITYPSQDSWMGYSIISDNHFPAWSLHRLLCLLPTEYTYDTDFQQITRDFVFGSQDMYDEVISCIETLSEEGYFYEEYLEK